VFGVWRFELPCVSVVPSCYPCKYFMCLRGKGSPDEVYTSSLCCQSVDWGVTKRWRRQRLTRRSETQVSVSCSSECLKPSSVAFLWSVRGCLFLIVFSVYSGEDQKREVQTMKAKCRKWENLTTLMWVCVIHYVWALLLQRLFSNHKLRSLNLGMPMREVAECQAVILSITFQRRYD